MSSDQPSLSARISASYSQLSQVASDLNAVSDALGSSIAEIDEALKKLNLGITVWVQLRGGNDSDTHPADRHFNYWSEDLGYAKLGGRWCVGLRKVDGETDRPDDELVEAWPFNDAPRTLRLSAIDKIPDLLDKLSKEALATTLMLKRKLGEVQTVAAAVTGSAAQPRSKDPVESFGSKLADGIAKAMDNPPFPIPSAGLMAKAAREGKK
jgi:hypothetical protein